MSIHTNPGEMRRKSAVDRLDDAVEMNAVVAAIKTRDAEIKAFTEKAAAELKDTGKMAAETKAALEKLSESGAETQDRLQALEQKLARRSFGGGDQKSVGAEFIDLPAVKELQNTKSGTARMSLKTSISGAITSATTDANGSVGAGIVPDRLSGVVVPAGREFTIRDLLLSGTTSSNSIEYVEEKGFTNSAAAVAENPSSEKPKSGIQFELKTTAVKTLAHWFPASKQVLDDLPMLMSYINGRALYGLRYKEEEQILAGNGNSDNMLGLLPQASKFMESAYSAVGDTMIDTIRRAALQVRVAEYRPAFVVLNPVDWAAIELTKDDEKRYIEVSIRQGGEMRLWRLNVIETTAMAQGEFLVGSTIGAQVFDRETSAVQVSTQHADFFTRNMLAILAEERLALAVFRPESYVHGQFALGASLDSPPDGINV